MQQMSEHLVFFYTRHMLGVGLWLTESGEGCMHMPTIWQSIIVLPETIAIMMIVNNIT
jgi:hypothetical protein